MKKIIALLVLTTLVVTVYGQMTSKKKIINYSNRIEIIDSSAVDTSYAPYSIYKDNIAAIKIADTKTSKDGGGVCIYFNKADDGNNPRTFDYKIDAKELNDFSSNYDLYNWLVSVIMKPNLEYGFFTVEDDTMSIDSTDQVKYLSIETSDLASGDSIKVSGTSMTIDGIASTSIDFTVNSSPMSIGIREAYIKELEVIFIGEGKIIVVK